MRHVFIALSTLGLLACGGHEGHSHAPSADVPSKMASHADMKQKGLNVSGAYINPPFPGRDTAAGFFKITNNGADDTLIAASSPISETVEIHTHLKEDGVMKMRQIPGVDLPSGETVEFKSGSYHLMLFNATIPEGSDTVELTLTYQNAGDKTLTVPVGEPETNDSGDHSGH